MAYCCKSAFTPRLWGGWEKNPDKLVEKVNTKDASTAK